MAERGQYPLSTARQRVTAIDALVKVLGEEEQKDPYWILENLAELANRWATKNNAKPKTVMTYESRARGALRDYLDYLQDPGKFKPRRRTTGKTERGQAQAKSARSSNFTDDSRQVSEQKGDTPPQPELRSFPLAPKGPLLGYRMPAEGVSVRDVWKIACHLATMASDFDPTNPSQSALFIRANREAK
jgi:hypothetical protein